MEDNSIIAVIKFVSGESIRIRCSEYSFDLHLVCFDDDKVVFVAPIGQIVCVYEEKYRIFFCFSHTRKGMRYFYALNVLTALN